MSESSHRAPHTIALRFLSALLWLYPRAFREEFGAAVRAMIARDLEAASHGGSFAFGRAVAAYAVDIVLSSMRQRVSLGRRGAGDGLTGAWSAWRRDASYGIRLLVKQRTFSAVVVTTLALAIGANTVIFSFTNILLLRPLPVREPETLGWIFGIGPHEEGNRARTSLPDFIEYRTSLRSFTALGGRRPTTLTLSKQGDAQRLDALQVTSNVFDIWGLRAVAGRVLKAGEDVPGAEPVVLLSHRFWQQRFGSDPTIIGKPLVLDGVNHVVVGVVDPAIEIGNLSTIDVWTPLIVDPSSDDRASRGIAIVGRLARSVTHERANREVHALAQRLQREHPLDNAGWDARVVNTHDAITGNETWMILALFGLVVAFVLLIACANLANLMLARSADRVAEVAVRTALGAGRGAIVRQLVTESLLLGVVGGIVGLAVAQAGLVLIKAYSYEEFFALLSIDRNVLGFAAVVTVFTSVAFSLIPAIRSSRADVAELLAAGSRRTSLGVGARRGRSALVVSQVALAMSLTVVAALVVLSLVKSARSDVGFDTHDLFVFHVDVPASSGGRDEGRPFYEQTLTELASLPGVTAVAASDRLPVLNLQSARPLAIEGRPAARQSDQPWAAAAVVSEAYFATTRIPVISGRVFARADADSGVGLPVAIVNQEMARRYWGSASAALGQRVSESGSGGREWATIVGVVGDTKAIDVTLPPSPQLYRPMAGRQLRTVAFLVRSERAAGMFPDVRAAMRRVAPELALYDARTFDEAFGVEMSTNYVLSGMYLAFAMIALSLAAAGLYGVVSYSVSQRTREIGIRVALGATARDVSRLVMAHGGRLLIAGTVLGVIGGAVIARSIRALLYDVSPLDPTIYGLVIGVIAVVMGVATYVPARRAMRVDPIRALRAD